MNTKLTIQEKPKDLRVERHLTLEQLAEETGISKSALGKYESDDFKDISPFSIVTLAKYYGVSTDYLLGLTETKNHPNADLLNIVMSENEKNYSNPGTREKAIRDKIRTAIGRRISLQPCFEIGLSSSVKINALLTAKRIVVSVGHNFQIGKRFIRNTPSAICRRKQSPFTARIQAVKGVVF